MSRCGTAHLYNLIPYQRRALNAGKDGGGSGRQSRPDIGLETQPANPHFGRWLLLDSRVVDVLRLSNLILVTLASLKPFFFNGLKKALHFSDNVGA